MEDYGSSVFSPLTKDFCVFFYVLSVAMFVFFVFILFHIIVFISSRNIMSDSKSRMFLISLGYFSLLCLVIYFQSRLLYSMCIKSLV